MKPFKKDELFSILVIFSILVAVSVPNFIVSLRRARDQVRRDDLGVLQHALDSYYNNYKEFPLSTDDGRMIACLAPGDEFKLDERGKPANNFVPCEWGKDPFLAYISILPADPQSQKGSFYRYISDGERYQIFASFEDKSEPEYDKNIAARNLSCGARLCNVGRFYSCSVYKSIKQCEDEAKRGI
jgi:type II secretory pathway pseudopilin PulG